MLNQKILRKSQMIILSELLEINRIYKKNRISHVNEIKLNEKCFFEKELKRTGRKLYEE